MAKREVEVRRGNDYIKWVYEDGNSHVTLYFEEHGPPVSGVKLYSAQITLALNKVTLSGGLGPENSDDEIRRRIASLGKTAFNRVELELGFAMLHGVQKTAGLMAFMTLIEAAGLIIDPVDLKVKGARAMREIVEGSGVAVPDVNTDLQKNILIEMARSLETGEQNHQNVVDLAKDLAAKDGSLEDPDVQKQIAELQEIADRKNGKDNNGHWGKWNKLV